MIKKLSKKNRRIRRISRISRKRYRGGSTNKSKAKIPKNKHSKSKFKSGKGTRRKSPKKLTQIIETIQFGNQKKGLGGPSSPTKEVVSNNVQKQALHEKTKRTLNNVFKKLMGLKHKNTK